MENNLSLSEYENNLTNKVFVDQISICNESFAKGQIEIVEEIAHSIGKFQTANVAEIQNLNLNLEKGLSTVVNNLTSLEDNIVKLSNLVGNGFDLVVENLKIALCYLSELKDLSKLDDDEKKRGRLIEKGLMYLKNANEEDPFHSAFYGDALDCFICALEIDDKDFFSLYRIGLIHLNWKGHIDLQVAESNFKKAARYALAESRIDGTNSTHYLLPNCLHKDGLKLESAQALLYASIACYWQDKVTEAIDLARKSWETYHTFYRAGFYLCKYLAKNNQVKEASKWIRSVIKKDRNFFKESKDDPDLNSKTEILAVLEKLHKDVIDDVRLKYALCKDVSSPVANQYLDLVRGKMVSGVYADARDAIDIMVGIRRWEISVAAHLDEEEKILPVTPSKVEINCSLVDFAKFEEASLSAIPIAEKLVEISNLENEKRTIKLQTNLYSTEINKNDEDTNIIVRYGLGCAILPVTICLIIMIALYSIVGSSSWFFQLVGAIIIVAILRVPFMDFLSGSSTQNKLSYQKAELDSKIRKIDQEIISIKRWLIPYKHRLRDA